VRPTIGPPTALARAIAEAVARVDASIGVTFSPLEQQVDAALVQERVMAVLSGSFGVLALALAAIGLYGITAYTVNRRRTEIGIRMAIGAGPGRVVRLVLRRIALLLMTGVLIGTAISIWASALIAALLYGVAPRDPATLAGAIVTLVCVGALTGFVPAWRAARIDPAAVLREG